MGREQLEVHVSIELDRKFSDDLYHGYVDNEFFLENYRAKHTKLYNVGMGSVHLLTFTLDKTTLTYIDLLDRLACIFTSELFKPTRVKLEEMWWNRGLPEDSRYEFKPHEYFEVHVKVKPNNVDDFLTRFPLSYPEVSLSKNSSPLKEGEFFLTQRFKNTTKAAVETRLTCLCSNLTDFNCKILEVEREFISLDTNLQEDEQWGPIICPTPVS